MGFDRSLAQRVREVLAEDSVVDEKKMFGGIAFMVSGNMCCGVIENNLMGRVGAEQYENALKAPHTRKMDFAGKPLRGFIYVGERGIASDEELRTWISRCEKFVKTLPPK